MKDELRLPDSGYIADRKLELALEATLRPDQETGFFLPAYKFTMKRIVDGSRVGEIGLKIGNPPEDLGHIWNRVFPEHRGNRYAARACKLLVPLANRNGVEPLWITCWDEKTASRRTC